MTTDQIVLAVLSVFLGGGLFTGGAAIWKAKQESKKVPVDLSAITVNSAERALLMLKTLLDEAEEVIAELKKERDADRAKFQLDIEAKDQRILELESQLINLVIEFQEIRKMLNNLLSNAHEVAQHEIEE